MGAHVEVGLIAAITPVLLGHEGEKLHVYKDSLGIPTVGVGVALMQQGSDGKLLPSHYAQVLCARVGVTYSAILSGDQDLTSEQSRTLLSLCIIDVVEWETILFPRFDGFTQPRQVALVDMGFELGETRFRGFKQMIACILAGNWWSAADQAIHSKWASEVPTRAAYDAGLLRAG